jgi:hypothetical protein
VLLDVSESRTGALDRAANPLARTMQQCMETDDEDVPSTGAELAGNGIA